MEKILRNAKNCGSGKIKGARNCGYARMEKLACAVFYLFSSCVKECELLFSRLLLFFYAFVTLYCCVVSEPGQHLLRNEEVSGSNKVPAVIENQLVSYQNFTARELRVSSVRE